VPSSGVAAVALNVAVTNPSAGSYVTLYPTGTPKPTASNLNFDAGETIPNVVVAKVGTNGKVSIYNNWGSTDVVVDVQGWYSDGTGTQPTSGLYSGFTPVRILDTRYGLGGISAKVGAGQSVSLQVAGVGGVPSTGVGAVVLNVAVTNPSAGSYLTLYPSGTSKPTASNLNFNAGETIPNVVFAKVGANGKVSIYNNWGSTDVVVDLQGWSSS
jgi:acyl-coenzyme A synthetase/AMP-(fatty) acid ligase